MEDSRAIDRAEQPDRIMYSMRALGRAGLPDDFELDGIRYRLWRSVKHDFVAATGFYRDADGRKVVLKISRTVSFAGIPLHWMGRWACRREMHFYRRLADLPNVPRLLGQVGTTGFVHEYVEGRPLSAGRAVPDGFFQQLQELLSQLHRRNIAYVDTNKPQNILLGEDGRPHLIDFQISLDLACVSRWGWGRWLLRLAAREDFYHILKHKRRLRPDELNDEELIASRRKSPIIRLHRFLFKPYFFVRRRLFRHLRATGRLLPEGSK